jgi:lipopolysaccharide heptosyltransferase II
MNETKPTRLLAVNLNYLGDALFTTPALATLRERFPEAKVDVLAGERAAAILRDNPCIDRLLTRPPRGGAGRAMNLARTLRDGHYDVVVLFQSTLANAALAWTAHVPIRVGFNQDGCGPFLTHGVAGRQVGEHVVDAYTRLARAFDDPYGGATAPGPGANRLSVTVSPADEAFADDFLHNRELAPPIVGLVVGATRPQKRWPEEYFARLADKLWGSAGICSVLLGGPEEAEAAERILAQARSPLVSAVGLTTAKQLAALVARLGVVVSGDSGPLHIATAMDTPVVALFGSTDPAETGPWKAEGGIGMTAVVLYDSLPCAPCRKNPTCSGRFDCLRALTPERVFDEACKQLQLPPRRAALSVIAATGGKGGEI